MGPCSKTPAHSPQPGRIVPDSTPPSLFRCDLQFQRGGNRGSCRPVQPQLGLGPPPDLWVNAKGVGEACQQPGFSQMARGAPVRQGAWAAPQAAGPAKPSPLSMQGQPTTHCCVCLIIVLPPSLGQMFFSPCR